MKNWIKENYMMKESVEYLFLKALMMEQSKKIMKKGLSSKEIDKILLEFPMHLIIKFYKDITEYRKEKNERVD